MQLDLMEGGECGVMSKDGGTIERNKPRKINSQEVSSVCVCVCVWREREKFAHVTMG